MDKKKCGVDGGWVSMACSKVCSGPAGVQPDTFGRLNKCLQQSGCVSELPPQNSWLDNPEEPNMGSTVDSHSTIRDRFQGCETYQV